MVWWAWLLLGFVLLAGELLTPGGFFVIFFAVAAVLLGLIGLAEPGLPAWAQWLLFSGLSVAAVLLFRRPLLARLSPRPPARRAADELVGETAVVLEAIAPGGIGRAELRGSLWQARSLAARELASGERCRVERVEGLVVHLAPEAGAASG